MNQPRSRTPVPKHHSKSVEVDLNNIETPETLRSVGFSDALKGIYRPESIAMGWARDAYRDGKEQAVLFSTLGDKS